MRNLLPKIPFALLLLAIAIAIVLGLTVWMQGYRTRILAQIQELAGKNLNGTLTIENLRFTPWKNGGGIIFSFYNVKLNDQRIKEHHSPLLSAACVSASLQFFELIQGTIKIKTLGVEDGKISVFVGKDGYTNTSIFGKIKEPDLPNLALPDRINFLGKIEKFVFLTVRSSIQTPSGASPTPAHCEKSKVVWSGLTPPGISS